MDWREYLKEWEKTHTKIMPANIRALRQEFIDRFPKENISNLKLEDYALGNPEKYPDSFCTWIEFKTKSLGSIAGGSAAKHGVYWSKDNDDWKWNKSFKMKTAEEAFQCIKSGLFKLISAIEEDRLSELDDIADNYLGKNRNVLRSKPLSLYYPEKFIPIFSVNELDYFLDFFGLLIAGRSLSKNLKLYHHLQSLPEFQNFDSWGIMRFLYDLKKDYIKISRSSIEKNKKAWIFQCKPELFNLKSALQELDHLTWLVNQHKQEIKKGDLVFLWESGKESGIVALGTISSEVEKIDQDSQEIVFNLDSSKFSEPQDRVKIKIDQILDFKLTREVLKNYTELSNLSILRFAQGTNFVVESDELTIILSLINAMKVEENTIWKISPGEKAWFWKECKKGGFISIGWDDLGDMSLLNQSLFESKSKELIALSSGKLKQAALNQVWKFANEIKIGDKILANRGTTEIVGIGTVTGDYYWADGETYPHRLPVLWEDTRVRDIDEKGWVRTLIPVRQEKYQEIFNSGVFVELYSLNNLLTESLFTEEKINKYLRSLLRKKHIIFNGSPGTGKTFLAEKLAKYLISESEGFFETIQFHPAYTYEDFVQGLRPTTDEDGNLRYEIVPGRFLEFCEKARARNGKCVLIIDEINRANLSAVFGELMYLLEYRDQEIKLAGSNEPFSIPENVYIIGTMNTADRSIAMVDHALRRRFAFIELRPDYNILRKWHEREETGFDVEPLIVQIEKVNEAIGDRHYSLGISFFLDSDLTENIADIWELEIYPYLEELFYSEPDKLERFTWEKIKRSVLGEAEI